MRDIAKVLTIAGSDSGGGAGIQADLKTFHAFRTYGMSALTAVTAQNTQGVQDIHTLKPQFVARQIESVASDIGIDGAKTGMLANAAIVEVVSELLQCLKISPLVVDPVMVAASGDSLLQSDAVEALKKNLLPITTILTPNLPEAEILLDTSLNDGNVEDAAKKLRCMGPEVVILKGGHVPGLSTGDQVVDVLCDERGVMSLKGEYVPTTNTHGTGCTFSAALAASLARGMSVRESAQAAKDFVTAAIKTSLPLGSGNGPTNHLVRPEALSREKDV